MTQGIGQKVNNVNIGAGYYTGDSFPTSSSKRGEARAFAIFDHADYRKPGVKSGITAEASTTLGRDFQTLRLGAGYGTKLYENGNSSLALNTGVYLKGEHTTNPDAKYVDNSRFDKQVTWCDETMVHNYNNVYGAAGITTGLTYRTGNLTASASAALEYGEHNGFGSSLDCTNSPASAHGDMAQYATDKAAAEGMRVLPAQDKLKGIFSASVDYNVSKHLSLGTGIEYNTAKPGDPGVYVRVSYNF